MPALPKFTGFDTNIVTIMTPKNIRHLANSIASRNIQLTKLKSSLAKERNMRDGRANVPTNVAIPFDSVDVTTLRRPATYLKKWLSFTYIFIYLYIYLYYYIYYLKNTN